MPPHNKETVDGPGCPSGQLEEDAKIINVKTKLINSLHINFFNGDHLKLQTSFLLFWDKVIILVSNFLH